jgi:Rnl2 family RNA ligase
MYDGTTFHCGKRKEVLENNENFFGHKSTLPSLEDKIKVLFSQLDDVVAVYVYGELFGGGYPHDEVAAIPDIHPVQTGIWYSPKIEFYAFDIQIQDIQNEKDYLNYSKCIDLFKFCGILYAEPLFIGKYEECLNYAFQFESTIPKKLGYPEIKGNKAEGIVIKPLQTMWAEGKKGKTRVILKIKPEEFQEKQYHQALKWPDKKESIFETNDYDLLSYEMYPFITDQRINNTISKIGTINRSNADKLVTMFVSDVMESFLAEFQNQWDRLSSTEKTNLQDLCKKESIVQIKRFLKK